MFCVATDRDVGKISPILTSQFAACQMERLFLDSSGMLAYGEGVR